MKHLARIIAACAVLMHRMAGHTPLANLLTATRYTNGRKTLTANEAVLRHALVKFDTTDGTILNCTTAAIPLGIARSETASGDPCDVALVGGAPGTDVCICDAAVARDAFLVPGVTAGRARTLPGTTGTYYVFGRALTTGAAAGDEIEFVSCAPYKVVVP